MTITQSNLIDLLTRAASVIRESEGADDHSAIIGEFDAAARELPEFLEFTFTADDAGSDRS